MFLKVGIVMMSFALAFAGTVAVIALRAEPKEGVVAAKPAAEPSVEPLVRSYSPPEPQVKVAGPEPRSELRAEPESKPEPRAEPRPEPRAEPRAESKPEPTPESERRTLPVARADWPMPTDEETQAASEPRHYELPPGATMGLTIEAIGIYDAPVFDSASQWALDHGVSHMPETSLPWTRAPQRNVYLAGHRLGWPGTRSHLVFYYLDKLGRGDEILLKNRDGGTYRYRVTEAFVVGPRDAWVMGQVPGRDMVTLQTCTPIPSFEKRIIVRADRV